MAHITPPPILRSPRFWIALGVSAGALALVSRNLDWQGLRDALGDANYALLPLAVLFIVAALYLRALRWNVLLRPAKGLSIRHLFGAVNVGYLVNNTLPFRLGELARVYVISRTTGVSKVRALSTVLVERFVDLIAVAGLLVVSAPLTEEPAWLTTTAWVMGGLAVAGMAILANFAAEGSWSRRLAYRAAGWLPENWQSPVRDTMGTAASGLDAIRSPTAMFWVAVLTIGTWLATALAMYVVIRAFALSGGLGSAFYVAAATTLSTVIPAAPGYLGVFHVAAANVMTDVFGAGEEQAFAFALVLHALVYLTPVALGLAYLWTNRGLVSEILPRLSQLRAARVDEDDGGERPRADPSFPAGDV